MGIPILRMVRVPGDVRAAVWLVVALRIGLGLAGVLTVLLDPRPLMRAVAAWTELEVTTGRPWTLVFSVWQRWDALWYERIATHGYAAGDNTAAFFPLFPLLERVAAVPFLGNVTLGGLLVATLATIASLVLLYRLARPIGGRRAAATAALLLVTSPVAFFLLAPYTESLFLALTLMAFVLMRSEHPLLAGVAGTLAALTRLHGVLLVPALAFVALRRTRAQGFDVRDWIGASLPALGTAIALLYPRLVVGESLSPLDVQRAWGNQTAAPWQTLTDALGHIAATGDPIELLNLATVVLLTALALAAIRVLPAELSAYALLSVALLWLRDTHNLSPMMSAARYGLVIFPCLIVAALALRRRPALAALIAVVGLVTQVTLFSYCVRWGFVG